MKKLSKILTIVLSTLFVLCFLTNSLGCKKPPTTPIDPPPEKPPYETPDAPLYQSENIIKNGLSDYVLITPSYPTSFDKQAKEDFLSLFKESTGITLPTITDDGHLTYTSESKYIVLGSKYICNMVGIFPTNDLLNDGYNIFTKDKSIFVVGKTSRGVLYGAYQLLTELFNYEIFTPDTHVIDKVSNLALPNFNITDNPDFNKRIGGWGSVYYNDSFTNANRMRFELNYSDLWVEDNCGTNIPWTHNMADVLNYVEHRGSINSALSADRKTAIKLNPNQSWRNGYVTGWFWTLMYQNELESYGSPFDATKNTESEIQKCVQPCLSGGSLPTDTEHPVFDEMVAYATQRIINILDANPTNNNYFKFNPEDNSRFCQCVSCLAWYKHYEGPTTNFNDSSATVSRGFSGLQLRFVNAVARKILKDRPDLSNYKIVANVYSKFTEAPVKKIKDVYYPIDQDVVCPENVIIYLAPTMDYTKNITNPNSNVNKAMLNVIDGLQAISSDYGAWLYQLSNYDDYFLPSNTFYSYGDTYRKLVDINTKWIFHQGAQIRSPKNTAFCQLKLYLNSKLAWDSSLDETQLIARFFDGYFGQASQTMKLFFDDMCNLLDTYGSPTSPSQVYFKKDVLTRWLNYCTIALEDIKPLQATDLTRYQQLKTNIECEALMPKYLLIRLYNQYNGQEIQNLTNVKQSFIQDCLSANVKVGNNQSKVENIDLSLI